MNKTLFKLLSIINRFFPRNKHIWVSGKITSWEYDNNPPVFFDNSKYFYLFLINNTKEKVYWLSSSQKEIDLLKSMGLPVVRFPSVKGIFLVLRAKFSFHHYGPDQIDDILQRGMIQLDFWHGTPLKKIRYDVVEKPEEKHDFYHDFMNKNSREYVSSTSKFLSDTILKRAFLVEDEQLLNFGYPRTDIFALNEQENLAFCQKYAGGLLEYIHMAKQFSKVFIYMPTFRDNDPGFLAKANIDFERLSKALKTIDGVLFLKLHPLTKLPEVQRKDNIIQIPNDVDIYPFLMHTHYLITDYSSIYFDYLLLNKEIIFIPYDYDDYIKNRELYFDYDSVTPGVKYYSFDDFIDNLVKIDLLNYENERKKLISLLYDEYDFDASEKTYGYLKDKYC